MITSAAATGASTLASSAAVAAFDVGNAAGAFLGGIAIAAGSRDTSATLVGAAMALTARAAAALRRRRAVTSRG